MCRKSLRYDFYTHPYTAVINSTVVWSTPLFKGRTVLGDGLGGRLLLLGEGAPALRGRGLDDRRGAGAGGRLLDDRRGLRQLALDALDLRLDLSELSAEGVELVAGARSGAARRGRGLLDPGGLHQEVPVGAGDVPVVGEREVAEDEERTEADRPEDAADEVGDPPGGTLGHADEALPAGERGGLGAEANVVDALHEGEELLRRAVEGQPGQHGSCGLDRGVGDLQHLDVGVRRAVGAQDETGGAIGGVGGGTGGGGVDDEDAGHWMAPEVRGVNERTRQGDGLQVRVSRACEVHRKPSSIGQIGHFVKS